MAELSLNELKLVLSEISSICDKWYCIGFELDLPVDYLEDLDTQLTDKQIDVARCLRKVLVEWIKSNQATWPTLIRALSGDLVKEEGLASVLQRKYSGSSFGECMEWSGSSASINDTMIIDNYHRSYIQIIYGYVQM